MVVQAYFPDSEYVKTDKRCGNYSFELGALAEVELDRQLAGLRLCSDAASDAALSDAAPAAARRRAAAEDAATAITEIEGRRSSVNATQVTFTLVRLEPLTTMSSDPEQAL